jgi:hypothetical protein
LHQRYVLQSLRLYAQLRLPGQRMRWHCLYPLSGRRRV